MHQAQLEIVLNRLHTKISLAKELPEFFIVTDDIEVFTRRGKSDKTCGTKLTQYHQLKVKVIRPRHGYCCLNVFQFSTYNYK